ncbi:SdiA-regulated domain-containing protein [Fulvivirga ligni]|uniref:SdiA-regulated domain-containing protein n=1 Tax=Fulvivirga ligni TaxID=2904246 RepID=UPI001F4833CD|nr:SdiA-regulated domain-containing protein [Fulvivirga ligni]UII19682.1 SdiA-regulated domain-containing protein [Fulvivirga ligni]
MEAKLDIVNEWSLPEELDEISGMVWVEDNIIAAIQDEDGIIYSYDLEKKDIVHQSTFGDKGDYEGLAIKGSTAYVVRSDGTIFQVDDWRNENPKTSEWETFLTDDHNVEGITLSADAQSLLLTVKDEDPSGKSFKGIYTFDLISHQLRKEPIAKIDFDDAAFNDDEDQGDDKVFNPSGIDVHPKTGEMYIVDGKKSKLIIMDKQWKIKKMVKLSESQFPQPESITFSNSGTMYISNEGKKGSANILQPKGL